MNNFNKFLIFLNEHIFKRRKKNLSISCMHKCVKYFGKNNLKNKV